MFKFTTINEMEEKLIKVRSMTKEIKEIMTIQFPIEENNFNHLSTHKFHECIDMSVD